MISQSAEHGYAKLIRTELASATGSLPLPSPRFNSSAAVGCASCASCALPPTPVSVSSVGAVYASDLSPGKMFMTARAISSDNKAPPANCLNPNFFFAGTGLLVVFFTPAVSAVEAGGVKS